MLPPRPSSLYLRRERWFYLLISPWLLGLVLFSLGPVLVSLGLALTDWQPPKAPSWVGLNNFARLVQDPLALKTLLNTLVFTLASSTLSVGLGLLLALLLNHPGRLARTVQQIILLPALVSGVAMSLLWGWMFNAKLGILNGALGWLGIKGPNWLGDPNWAMTTLVLIQLFGVGTTVVVFLAALTQIPAEVLETAELEGANRLARLRFVVLPLLSPVSFYLLVVNGIGAFQVFTPTYVLTQGGPDNTTLTLPLYLYQNAFRYGRLGYASALAAELLLVVGLLTWVQFRLARRWVYEG
jgi:multiple sugar transport system permease protein